MYDDYDGPMNAVPVDDRERLMSEFVSLDREIDEMRTKRMHLEEMLDKAVSKQRDIRSRLGDALGFTSDNEAMKAAFGKAATR